MTVPLNNSGSMRIAVVMPTLDEAGNIDARARELRAQSGEWEWIVADGGSTDATIDSARAAGAVVVSSERGRGRQLDAGAGMTSGDILLFLHADTSLPNGALAAIRAVMHDPDIVGGNFTLRFDERGTFARVVETIYAARRRFLHSYFGDSAIFVRREIYARIGGFGDAPIMEDYAFAAALQRCGRTVCLPLAVVTSSRRYRGKPLPTLWKWFAIITLYRLGVAPAKLAPWYLPHATPKNTPRTRS